ncbi:hypothetical protein OPQ81_008864 [Rhizoctonia solani]|nr:hypothetical protein OPQ81_008864 [Rhizoctonia solani]
MCLDDDQDMWVPCTSVIRTSNTGTLSPSITEPSNTTPIVTRTITPTRTTRTRPPETFFPSVTSVETDEPTSVNEPTQTPETATHIPTRTRTTRPSSAASLETSNGFTPTSQVSLGSSVEVKPSSSREARPPSTQEEEPSSTREAVTVRGSSHSQSTRPVSTSTRLPQPPSSSGIMTSNFIVPISGGVSLPSPSSTITTAPGGIQGGALAGIIVGSILGVVGLLGLGAFLMKSFGTPRGRDLFAPRGAYQVAPGGGSLYAIGISQTLTGGWDRTYAYTGVAAAAAVAATTANNQRGRDSGTGGRYSDGGIRTEDTPDAIPRRYADGGISGPDSHFDPRITSHPYGDQDPRYLVSSSEVQFDPYHDLPVRQDSTPVGGSITRQSALTSPEISISPPGPTPAYPAVPEDVPGGYSGSTIQPAQTAPGVSLSGTDHLSITSFAPSIIDQTVQPQAPGNLYQGSPPYAEISGTGTIPYSSEPFAFTDIQRPPYWEDSIRAASVDSLPQHGNIPRYSALTDFGSVPGIGSSPAPGYNNTPGIGSAPTSVPGVGSVTGAGGPQPPGVVNPTWNSVGVTEFGQNVIDPSSAPGDATTCISVPEAPRGLHQGLTRLSTEVGSAQRGNTDPSSPRSASRAGIRPPRVGGPRPRPSRPSIPRPDSRYSLPPAYEERQNNT